MDDKKKTKAQLIAELEELRQGNLKSIHNTIFKTTIDGYCEVNLAGQFVEVNDKYCKMSGYTRKELLGMRITDVDAVESPEEAKDIVEKVAKDGYGRFERKHRRKNGSVFDVEISTIFIKESTQFVLFLHDITDRKNAEEALKKSEADLSNALKIAKMGHWEYDVLEDQFTFTDEFYSIYHTSAEKVGGYTMSSERYAKLFVHPDDVYVMGEAMQEFFETDDPNYKRLAEHRILYADGGIGYIDVYVRLFKDENGQTIKSVGVNQDITYRKNVEEALKKSTSDLSNALQLAKMGHWEYSVLENQFTFTDEFYSIFRTSAEEMGGYTMSPEKYTKHFVHPDDISIVVQAMQESNDPHYRRLAEHRILYSDGSIGYIDVYIRNIIGEDGKPIKAFGVIHDITARKMLEEKLANTVTLLEAQMNSTLEGIIVVDPDGKKILQNKRTAELWKIPQHIVDNIDDNVQVQHVKNMTVEPEKFVEKIKYLYDHPNETTRDEVELIDGTTLDRYSAPVFGKDGKNHGRIWTFRDITERKNAEKALKKSKSDLSNALKIAKMGHWEYDVIENLFTFTDEFYSIYHTSAEEMGGYTMSPEKYSKHFVHPDDINDVSEAILELIETKDPNYKRVLERKMLFPDGSIGYFEINFSIIKDEDGRTIKSFGVSQDITERKKAEEELRESEDKFSAIFSSMSEIAVLHELVFDKKGKPVNYRIIDCNNAYSDELGIARDDAIDKLATEVYGTNTPPYFDEYCQVALTGIPYNFETYFPPMQKHFFISVVTPRKNQFLTISSDITDRKKADEAIKASLAEKEILLKEIHHRVKNNLAIVSSLLSRQAEVIEDKQYVAIFNESINRIKAMSQIHEILYKSDDFSRIDFKEYVKGINKSISALHFGRRGVISLKSEINNVYLNLDDSIPCGLIINELITNAYKHAFPGDRNGEVIVSMKEMNDKTIEIKVSDNGIGIPKDYDYKNSGTMGLSIVNLLVMQLEGELKYTKTKLNEFIITFKRG